jgi:hypothetical protein
MDSLQGKCARRGSQTPKLLATVPANADSKGVLETKEGRSGGQAEEEGQREWFTSTNSYHRTSLTEWTGKGLQHQGPAIIACLNNEEVF